MLRIRLAAAALIAIAAAGSGCGGSSKTSSSTAAATTSAAASTASTATTAATGPALTRQQLVTRADAICKRIATELNSASPNTTQAVVQTASRLAASERTATAELSKLTPPASLASDWQQVVNSMQILAANTVKLGEAASAGKLTSAEKELSAANLAVRKPLLAIAARDGFVACTQVI